MKRASPRIIREWGINDNGFSRWVLAVKDTSGPDSFGYRFSLVLNRFRDTGEPLKRSYWELAVARFTGENGHGSFFSDEEFENGCAEAERIVAEDGEFVVRKLGWENPKC